MKFLSSFLLLALAADVTVASSWFSKSVYNKWHQTELERWLSDHDIPYPAPADRKDLEDIVKKNWQNKVASPYADWDPAQLQAYLKEKGSDVQKGTEKNKDSLLTQVKKYWYETEDSAESAWDSVKDWIFDSWTESQLKAFCDKHGIPAPQPRTRDTLLTSARSNYESAAKKVGETAAYPGNWLYESWSESDLKAWLDERGIPAPQPSSRDKLIASVRRNSRLASLKAQDTASSLSASAKGAQQSVSDAVFDTWSDSDIKAWADKNGIKVPQGSKRNELLALARKHKAYYSGDNVSASAASAYGAATSKAGNQYAKSTDDAGLAAQDAFDKSIGTWSNSRLKAYLDARGVPVPQSGKKDELVAAVRLQSHKAASGYSAWTFDEWTTENLKKWLESQGKKVSKSAATNRAELAKSAGKLYSSASKSSGTGYASMTSALATATGSVKASTFDTWSESDLKAYLDGYGIPVYQGSNINELRALARRQYNYFYYGTNTPSQTLLARVQAFFTWILNYLKVGGQKVQDQASYHGEKAYDRVKEGGTAATHRAGEAAQKASDRVKEEL